MYLYLSVFYVQGEPLKTTVTSVETFKKNMERGEVSKII